MKDRAILFKILRAHFLNSCWALDFQVAPHTFYIATDTKHVVNSTVTINYSTRTVFYATVEPCSHRKQEE